MSFGNAHIQPVKGGVNRDLLKAEHMNGLARRMILGDTKVVGQIMQHVGPVTVQPAGLLEAIPYTYLGICGWDSEARSDVWETAAADNTLAGDGSVNDIIDRRADLFVYFQIKEEWLATTDWTIFQSNWPDWLRPQTLGFTYSPEITVNGAVVSSGFAIDYSLGKVTFTNKIKGDSALTAQASSGQAIIYVNDVVGFATGDLIVIQGATAGENETKTILSVDGPNKKITCTTNLAYTHASGRTVIENDPIVRATFRYMEAASARHNFSFAELPPTHANHSFLCESEQTVGLRHVYNGLFTNWVDGVPDSWVLEGAGTAILTEPTTSLNWLQIPNGKGGVTLQANGDGFRYLKQTIDTGVSLGTSCMVSVWVRTSGKAQLQVVPSAGIPSYCLVDCTVSGPQHLWADKWIRLEVMVAVGDGPIDICLYAQRVEADANTAHFIGCLCAVGWI